MNCYEEREKGSQAKTDIHQKSQMLILVYFGICSSSWLAQHLLNPVSIRGIAEGVNECVDE